ncbi:MAG: hypothetical protein ABI142_12805, partial [Bryocella sp.]
MLRAIIFCAPILCASAAVLAQFPANFPQNTDNISASEAISKLQKKNVLTFEGKPFHAVLQIQELKGDPVYSGSIEFFWLSSTTYSLAIHSPAFS